MSYNMAILESLFPAIIVSFDYRYGIAFGFYFTLLCCIFDQFYHVSRYEVDDWAKS